MKLIPVTTNHIANGKVEKCMECPVALALLEAGFEAPEVYPHETIIRENAASHAHSDEVRWWLDDFDDDDVSAPQPVTLVLEPGGLLTLSEWQEERRG